VFACFLKHMMESISSDEELILLSAASAAVIVMRRRRRRRLKHQRKLWSKPWLLERDGVRGISNFVGYELSDDTSGFFRISTDVSASPRRRRHFAAAASHILSSRSQPFSRRAAAAAASHICVTAATPYFLANYNFHERKR
jgi:hypothetical protein